MALNYTLATHWLSNTEQILAFIKHTISIYYLYGVFHCDISICTYKVSWLHYPIHHSSLSTTTLQTLSTGFIVLFAYKYTKYINHIHPVCLSFLICEWGQHYLFLGLLKELNHIICLMNINKCILFYFVFFL
jgi:hypothetical protein